jgi:hypothetical protein
MAQKQFTVTQSGSKVSNVTVATNSDNLGGGIARLIISDTIPKGEVVKRVQALLDAFIEENFPF